MGGEVRDDPAGRWFYWAVSMCPFMYVLYELYFGLAEATKKHAPSVASLRVGPLHHGHLVADVPLRVHAQGHRPRRLQRDGLRAGRVLVRGHRRQGGLRHRHLAHRAREDDGHGGGGPAEVSGHAGGTIRKAPSPSL